jgi:alkanesulfonate monooxygenase SsuD/methylene tetrahydromethanopterin reductase-like flavin-dependent oxidoreductase (luciferase family)
MEFGIGVSTHVGNWDVIRYIEELGFDRAWVGDSQMIWSDCYATMALAAANTKRIKIGTGVAIAGTRIAPVTAHSIASINEIAPGRTFLGIGTGHTAMRVMGQNPIKTSEFREYLRVLRGLLDGKAIDYTYRGQTREIQFLHRDRHFINLDNRIPIYVAANGPKALEAAGAYADGWVTVGGQPEVVKPKIEQIKKGAKDSGRSLPSDFHTAVITGGCVLRPGEKLTDARVVDETGSFVMCELHFFYEIWKDLGEKDELVPPHFANLWSDYLKRVKNFSLPENARFRQIHDGHLVYMQPEERRFVTPEAIKASCLVGTPEEIVAQVRTMEKGGIREVVLWPPMDLERKIYRDFAELIFPHVH